MFRSIELEANKSIGCMPSMIMQFFDLRYIGFVVLNRKVDEGLGGEDTRASRAILMALLSGLPLLEELVLDVYKNFRVVLHWMRWVQSASKLDVMGS